jgi:transposase
MNAESNLEESLPHNHGAKSDRIDLGLALLANAAEPHAMLSPADIAAWCGCTPHMISSIEARALRRMREKVRAQFKISRSEMADVRRFLALHFQS